MGLLEELRLRAEGITDVQKKDMERLVRYAEQVDGSLRRAFSYFLEAASYLNVINPENKRSYAISNLGSLDGMKVSNFFVDYRTRSVIDKPRLDHFYVRYKSSADRAIEKELDFISAEKLIRILGESTIVYEQEDILNETEKILRKSLRIPYTLRSELVFKGDYSIGMVRVEWRNVERFGNDEFLHRAEEVDVSLLEDYVRFIMGENNQVRQRSRHLEDCQ